MGSFIWNAWHGCNKYSEGCAHCYVYRRDSSVGRDASAVFKTADFGMPTDKKRDGTYKIPPGSTVFAVMTSDFFLEDADAWRGQAWDMIRERRDLDFIVITKRILRAARCLPRDWGDGWDNFTICSTMENMKRFRERFPALFDFPAKHKTVICEPLLSEIDITAFQGISCIDEVVVGGESGPEARVCDYEWVLSLHDQCVAAGIPFTFRQTGANFRKDGKVYAVPRKLQHIQAKKAGIDFRPENTGRIL